MKPCPLCGGEEARVLYAARGLPLFQNKVYNAVTAARSVDTGDVMLAQCNDCDFAFNASFDPEKMEYDASYQNEQCFSAVFSKTLPSKFMTLPSGRIVRARTSLMSEDCFEKTTSTFVSCLTPSSVKTFIRMYSSSESPSMAARRASIWL